ncbi:Cell division protein FtsZ [Sphingobium herbicidovorans NBRC 16415]|jgi:cell division protein FtsZ|uniref:Cell division protein FtsZ n=1 Tax=Sphingobium herbicidovorans (strain ATCC 700291 / DSM 11019 / CCUG 56400 / KCTC 2939 / LMG 18315 / NBRC 16415 / MH) TaxID=1219045 RepID=A0A086PDY9_SPHHM|nr:cell division protein FtsZ [Sphingobium herbicidovorans]KFG91607.1 Cell division protein FtsZ [Sphingobium herbicidovorans NBRC 16415]
MSIEISPPHVDELKPRIAVIGVGGAGGNAIANMIAASVEGVDFIVANTDAQALNASPAERRIQLGPQITEGLGAGSRPEIGKAAAEETIASVEDALNGAHMCFIAAGMGGGTGTGAAPVIAKAARDKGILTVGVVTKPFTFEGNRRMKSAESGIDELQKHVDTLIVIPNQNLFLIANPNTTFKEAFQMADEVLQQGVRGITDLMVMPGLINLDFADVRSVMGEMGKAMMGTGEAEGDGRALQAAEKAIANPLLDGVSMRGAKGVIVSIVGGEDMRLMEVDEAANHIRELVDPDANIIWGSAFNDGLNGKIRVSVVATGIDSEATAGAAPLTQPFSFASRPAVSVPAAAASRQASQPAPVPAAAPEPEPETLELDVPAAPEPAPLAAPAQPAAATPKPAPTTPSRPAAVFSDEDPSQDELLLGAEEAEPAPAPAPAPQAAPRVATGGTLFERMAGLTRGADKNAAASEDAGSTPDIPRFLNRQSNQ